MSLIDAIVQHPDVVDPPNHAGEALAWCPWHPDRESGNASLTINVHKKIVKCFSCTKGGVKALARAWGIELAPDKPADEAPTLTAREAMTRLASIYKLRPETIEHFRIEPVPDSKSPARKIRGAWRYPTGAGARFKAFDRQHPQKVWWARGTRKEKRRSILYGIDDVIRGEPVYLVNGEPSVWTCYQAGVPAVCAFGEANLTDAQVESLIDAGVSSVRVVLDRDLAGERATVRDLDMLRAAGLEAKPCELPDYLGDKGDVSDLYVWHGADDDKFRVSLETLPVRPVSAEDPLRDTRFFVKAGALYLRKQTRDGELEIPLTNFTAYATSEVLLDDGLERVLHQIFIGRLESGEPLPEVMVPATKSTTLSWITEQWGFRPIIKSGPGLRENVREIIQRLSVARGLPKRTIYSHTGWREIDGRWHFLMPGGPVAGANVEVELNESYARYSLPATPEDITQAVRTSLRFLNLADRSITIPISQSTTKTEVLLGGGLGCRWEWWN